MKTPIEKAITQFENKDKISISDAITILQKLLPYEKEIIEDTYNDGWTKCNMKNYDNSEKYFNNKFKSNE